MTKINVMEKKIKILLVDDDKDLLQVLQVSLELNALFKVVTSLNGQEACFKFRNEDFDVVITDLKMPKMDGIEFIHAIKKIREVPIFVISASLEAFKFKMKEYKTRELKNIHVIPKPFDPDELGRKIKESVKPALTANAAHVVEAQVRFAAGDVVFEENSQPSDVFIVKEGLFIVFKLAPNGENVMVTKIKPGEVLGEMSVFSGGVRTSTVKAETDGVLIRLPMDKVRETLNGQPPWFRALMKTISIRLSDTTMALAEAKAEIKERDKLNKEA